MTQPSDVRSMLMAVRAVIETSPYDAIEALSVVRQLSAMASRDMKPIAQQAEEAVLKTFTPFGISHDALALDAMRGLVTAMERRTLRVVQ